MGSHKWVSPPSWSRPTGDQQLSHPQAALGSDVQDGEDGLVQDGVAHGLGAVGVGGHLSNTQD